VKRTSFAALMVALPLLVSGCGNVHQGPSDSLVRIIRLEGSSGASAATFGVPLISDVITFISRPADQGGNYFSTFNDLGRVTMDLVIKDPGAPGVTNVPSPLNDVTFTRYHVQFIRSDGHNVEGVDVPYSFDGASTFTVTPTGGDFPFEIVHNSAKQEAPLKALATNGQFINAIARVTFFGHDGAGKSVSVSGDLSVIFGDFADKTS